MQVCAKHDLDDKLGLKTCPFCTAATNMNKQELVYCLEHGAYDSTGVAEIFLAKPAKNAIHW